MDFVAWLDAGVCHAIQPPRGCAECHICALHHREGVGRCLSVMLLNQLIQATLISNHIIIDSRVTTMP